MGLPTTPPQVGVVIVSYNTRDLLRDCLHSLRGCTLPLRVLVVDNSSADGSAALVREQFPEVHLLARSDNPGFAAGNNLGLRWLGYGSPAPDSTPPPYALLLNPDTVVHPGALEELVAFLEAHPRVGLVGPRLLNPDGSVQAAAFRFPTLTMSLLDVFPPGEVLPGRLYGSWWHGRYAQEQAPDAAPFAIDHPLGACMLVRRRTLAEVGLLDEHYFMYGEEIDWCWRMRRANWAIWQVPAAQVTHIGGAATRQFRARMLVELHRSRVRLFGRYRGPGFVRAHRLMTRAGMLRAALRDWAAYGRGRLPRAELRARLWAYGLVCRL
jgi:hypothetical protein